ncbi:3-phosphoshikimate 1-carboxyvinyltransferase [Dictyobacter alpinus]|uniref:3-phosphoshikimate 1-carboxyvinyltransferase n=1 Tax=Dictyobacter alpinus TaxID=2014873 RepID=A0A402B8R8_9CHLR|nr:3-phosphoshikimate 1-carboxyvinyltransferase [Dictyobacter alpinus]GCE27726.1 3-phosphoshikimate 1-carboxyvinyltransferase [Dictyobacter alpinus]
MHKPDILQDPIFVAPSSLLPAQPEVPSSKYYTLRYILAAVLAPGESRIILPALSDDSDALFRGCRALGAELRWEDEQQHVLLIRGIGRPHATGPVTINVGNAGAVLRLLLGLGAMLPDVTFVTDHPQSLGKRPNRELLEALTQLGVMCESTGSEGFLPITLHGGAIHGGKVTISGARSSQYLSSLLFLAPLLPDGLEITVVDGLKSQPLVRATLEVLQEAGIQVDYAENLLSFRIAPGQQYQPREYTIPGDYPAAAALLAAYAVSNDPSSTLRLSRLRPGDEVGEALLQAFRAMGADLRVDGEQVTLRGGRRLQGFSLDGDPVIDCIPVLVAAACFAEGESVISNIESLHYKESDRINDLCTELRKAGCSVEPQEDAIIIQGQPQGVEGGVTVDGHNDHRVLMALAIVGLRSRSGLILTGAEHIAKSYPHFFEELQRCGADIHPVAPQQ